MELPASGIEPVLGAVRVRVGRRRPRLPRQSFLSLQRKSGRAKRFAHNLLVNFHKLPIFQAIKLRFRQLQ